ncbi:EKA homolg (putative) [Blumeria hordei DH14]|uniref:EKA homolg (Putative) n=1 Tax=Blumeria graminis f. sp. hordei (strain DH14) TaxID=546991 RepID=N1J8Z6_BLUG1|nr:EKA homolg (putative) [Blumeria hordei DH14]
MAGPSNPSPTYLKQPETATKKEVTKTTSQPKVAAKAEYPLKLPPILEAEERHAAINSVGISLFPLTNGTNKQFVDSMRVYTPTTIAQYIASELTTMTLVLPPRPADPLPRAPDARSIPTPAIQT